MSNQEKSLLMIELENEARAKEILDRDQIYELNRAMYEGKDLNQAAQCIFGSSGTSDSSQNSFRVKSADNMFYGSHNYH